MSIQSDNYLEVLKEINTIIEKKYKDTQILKTLRENSTFIKYGILEPV
jgi:hypothetical protein